jgi:hypothetical protein
MYSLAKGSSGLGPRDSLPQEAGRDLQVHDLRVDSRDLLRSTLLGRSAGYAAHLALLLHSGVFFYYGAKKL